MTVVVPPGSALHTALVNSFLHIIQLRRVRRAHTVILHRFAGMFLRKQTMSLLNCIPPSVIERERERDRETEQRKSVCEL